MTFRQLGLALALALPVSLSACLEQSCDLIFIPALNISVIDDQGDPVEGANVTFTVANSDAAGDCAEDGVGVYTCGPESGDYTILVEADGFEAGEAMVSVGSTDDGCHPETEQVEIALAPAP